MKYFHGLSQSILLASKKISKICKPEKCSFYPFLCSVPSTVQNIFPEFPRSYLKWGTGTFQQVCRDVGSSENMGGEYVCSNVVGTIRSPWLRKGYITDLPTSGGRAPPSASDTPGTMYLRIKCIQKFSSFKCQIAKKVGLRRCR